MLHQCNISVDNRNVALGINATKEIISLYGFIDSKPNIGQQRHRSINSLSFTDGGVTGDVVTL